MKTRGTGSVYRRKGSPFLWIGFTQRGKYVRESSESADRNVALDLLKKRLGEVQANRPVVRKKVTVDELLADLVADFETHKKPSLPTLRGHVKALTEALGGMKASEVALPTLNAVAKRWLVAGVMKSTCNRRLGALKRAFRLAHESGVVATIPPKFPHFDEGDLVRQGFVAPADFATFLAALPDDGLRDFCQWLGLTGMRRGEAAKLTWAMVDGTTLRVPSTATKNKKPRTLPLVAALADIITARREHRKMDVPFIFHRRGRAVKEFRKTWRRAMKATGLRILPHDLRRSAVRNLLAAGVDRETAMRISGHKTASVFSRYAITTDAQVAAGLEAVSGYVKTGERKVAKLG